MEEIAPGKINQYTKNTYLQIYDEIRVGGWRRRNLRLLRLEYPEKLDSFNVVSYWWSLFICELTNETSSWPTSCGYRYVCQHYSDKLVEREMTFNLNQIPIEFISRTAPKGDSVLPNRFCNLLTGQKHSSDLLRRLANTTDVFRFWSA